MTTEPKVIVEGMLWSGRRFAPRTFKDWAEAAEWIASDLALMPAVRTMTLRDLGPAPALSAAQDPEAA